jgi:hypothetical protein
MDVRAGLTNSTPVELHVMQFDDLSRTVTVDVALHNPVPAVYFIDHPRAGSSECIGGPSGSVPTTSTPSSDDGDDAAHTGTYDMIVDCDGSVAVVCPGGDTEAFFDYACPIRQQVTT